MDPRGCVDAYSALEAYPIKNHDPIFELCAIPSPKIGDATHFLSEVDSGPLPAVSAFTPRISACKKAT
jgi:hypothetical protein